jgi:cytochrome P450
MSALKRGVSSTEAGPPHYDPTTRGCQEDPYPIYRELLDRHPVYHNTQRGFWALSRFDDVQDALRDWRAFSNAEGVNLEAFGEIVGPEMLNMDPPRHDVLRSVVHRAFTPAAIAALEQSIGARVHQLLDPLLEDGRGDMAQEFSMRLPVLVICDLLGIPASDVAEVQRKGAAMLVREAGAVEIPAVARAAGAELREYFSGLCAERQTHPQEDLIGLLAQARPDGEPLSQEELLGMCMILYSAGNTTTSSLISNGLWVLACHPSERARLARDLSRLPIAVEELLRFESPVQYTSRVTTRPVELHGRTIAAGERVVMVIGAANRDGARWDNPDVLDVLRPVKRNLAFGEGIHFCIGAHLARLEARKAFEAVLTAAPEYDVTEPPVRLYFSPERGLAQLQVTF